MQNKLYDANLAVHTNKILLVKKFKLEFRKWFKKGSSIVTSTSSQLFLNAALRFGFDKAHFKKRNILIQDKLLCFETWP